MILDMFLDRRRLKKVGQREHIDEVIEAIEKFAPRQHRSDREVFFYNYRIQGLYFHPLLALLETVLQRKTMRGEDSAFERELFTKLKAFYDPKDKLTLSQAAEDWGMKRKYSELLLFFYGHKVLPHRQMGSWVTDR